MYVYMYMCVCMLYIHTYIADDCDKECDDDIIVLQRWL